MRLKNVSDITISDLTMKLISSNPGFDQDIPKSRNENKTCKKSTSNELWCFG